LDCEGVAYRGSGAVLGQCGGVYLDKLVREWQLCWFYGIIKEDIKGYVWDN